MKVYVLTLGQYSYEDNVVVEGVFKKEEDAIEKASKQPGVVNYNTAMFGQYYYRVEEFDLE